MNNELTNNAHHHRSNYHMQGVGCNENLVKKKETQKNLQSNALPTELWRARVPVEKSPQPESNWRPFDSEHCSNLVDFMPRSYTGDGKLHRKSNCVETTLLILQSPTWAKTVYGTYYGMCNSDGRSSSRPANIAIVRHGVCNVFRVSGTYNQTMAADAAADLR